jgi:CheY-like chemotaxis protein
VKEAWTLSVGAKATPSDVAAPGWGISPLDERTNGLAPGAFHVLAGPPGPAKLVAALQFAAVGVSAGQRVLLLTNAIASDILDVASAWGLDLRPAHESGALRILGFRDDFELRVLRSAEPEDVLDELSTLAPKDLDRIVVDPGGLFIQGGARTLLGRAFVEWARRQRASVLLTLAIDGAGLPASAEWLTQVTDGVLLVDHGPDGVYHVDLRHARHGREGSEQVTLQLVAGRGLVAPEVGLSRRRADRSTGHGSRLLLVDLGDEPGQPVEEWACRVFTTEVVREALDGVSSLQDGSGFGCVLIHAPRERVSEVIRACRAMRPLTGSPIIAAFDDAIRSTDRAEILEAGADDCLSAGVDVRELAVRIRQAAESGGKPAPSRSEAAPRPARPLGGPVDRSAFRTEIERRLSDPFHSVLTVLRVTRPGGSDSELNECLSDEIRTDHGDLVVPGQPGFLVLLQGARREAARAFTDRVRSRLANGGGAEVGLLTEVYSHPGDRLGILRLTSADVGAAIPESARAPGGGGAKAV